MFLTVFLMVRAGSSFSSNKAHVLINEFRNSFSLRFKVTIDART